jgi:hypothetical protein
VFLNLKIMKESKIEIDKRIVNVTSKDYQDYLNSLKLETEIQKNVLLLEYKKSNIKQQNNFMDQVRTYF